MINPLEPWDLFRGFYFVQNLLRYLLKDIVKCALNTIETNSFWNLKKTQIVLFIWYLLKETLRLSFFFQYFCLKKPATSRKKHLQLVKIKNKQNFQWINNTIVQFGNRH